MGATKGLSNAQLELLKMFSMNLSEKQLVELKELLTGYFQNSISDDMDKLFEDNGWGQEKVEEWKSEHMRTKYSS